MPTVPLYNLVISCGARATCTLYIHDIILLLHCKDDSQQTEHVVSCSVVPHVLIEDRYPLDPIYVIFIAHLAGIKCFNVRARG